MKTIRFARRAACLVLMSALAVQGVAAQDLQDLGLTLLSTQQNAGQYVYELGDTAGKRLTVLTDSEITDEQAQRAAYLYQTILGWEWMDAPGLRVTLRGRKAEALVVPSRYTYDGLNLVAFLPSGMQFYLDTILEYDFRMKVGSLFLRVKGQFFDAATMSTRVAQAARDPVAFLQESDPEYLIRTLQDTASALAGLQAEGLDPAEQLRSLVAGVKEWRETRPVLEAEIQELGTALQDLTAQLEASQDALAAQMNARIETTRAGVLAAGNAGLFSGPRPLDPAMVARVVELKTGNTALVTPDILTTLKAEGIAANKKQVDLILLVYFGPQS